MNRLTGEGVEPTKMLDVIVHGERFWTNGAMAQQASEVQELMTALPGLHMEFKGDGLLAAIWAERKRLGYPV